jgi:hypothetical protein
MTRAVSSSDFQSKYAFYVIVPDGKDYLKYKAVALSSEVIIGDSQPIKTGG